VVVVVVVVVGALFQTYNSNLSCNVIIGNQTCHHFVDFLWICKGFCCQRTPKSLVALIMLPLAESLLHSNIILLVFHVCSLFGLRILAFESCEDNFKVKYFLYLGEVHVYL